MSKVMVVDDSKTVRNYHGSILKSMGIEVVEAENGMEALERSLDSNIDLFLVDVNMPIMDGYSFIADLRKQEAYKKSPVIMVTTQAKEDDKISAYKVGANMFETKPIKPDVLQAYIDILLNS
ncbi:response regulator [Sulfurimonas sp.]|nr:response regulator [Sulfurimonas sp.]